MVIFYIGLDWMHHNFIMLYLYLMLKKVSHNISKWLQNWKLAEKCSDFMNFKMTAKLKNWPKNVVILWICACCLSIIMVILYTSLDFMHNTFIMKYVCLILKNLALVLFAKWPKFNERSRALQRYTGFCFLTVNHFIYNLLSDAQNPFSQQFREIN